MKAVIQLKEDRLDKMVGFKDAVSKELLVVFKVVDKLNKMFNDFEIDNQPLIKDLPVFLGDEIKTFYSLKIDSVSIINELTMAISRTRKAVMRI